MSRQVDEALIKAFGMRVREIRQEKGMTMKELAAKSGLPYSQISRIELGQVNTSIDSAGVIAKALGVELKELF